MMSRQSVILHTLQLTYYTRIPDWDYSYSYSYSSYGLMGLSKTKRVHGLSKKKSKRPRSDTSNIPQIKFKFSGDFFEGKASCNHIRGANIVIVAWAELVPDLSYIGEQGKNRFFLLKNFETAKCQLTPHVCHSWIGWRCRPVPEKLQGCCLFDTMVPSEKQPPRE